MAAWDTYLWISVRQPLRAGLSHGNRGSGKLHGRSQSPQRPHFHLSSFVSKTLCANSWKHLCLSACLRMIVWVRRILRPQARLGLPSLLPASAVAGHRLASFSSGFPGACVVRREWSSIVRLRPGGRRAARPRVGLMHHPVNCRPMPVQNTTRTKNNTKSSEIVFCNENSSH